MKFRKIVLGLLTCLLLSDSCFVANAVKIENISCTREKIINLVKARPDRKVYLERKVKLFDDILEYCYQKRTMLELFSKNHVLATIVSEYILKRDFPDFSELNVIDHAALSRVYSYDELVYNLAVMYLSYRDLVNPLNFAAYDRRAQEFLVQYVTMELFHTKEEVAAAKREALSERREEDQKRVDELLDERIWFRGAEIAPLFSDIRIPVAIRIRTNASEILEDTPIRPATAPVFEGDVTKKRDGASGVPDYSAEAPYNTDADSDFDDLYPTPSDFLASLGRTSPPQGLLADSSEGRVPSLSAEARESFGREMFQSKLDVDKPGGR